MFLRDRARFAAVVEACEVMPLGAGALAGVNFATDRDMVAAELGFTSVARNSIDAVSNRDFVLDYLAAAATTAMHLSRLGAEIVLWCSDEFGFCELWMPGARARRSCRRRRTPTPPSCCAPRRRGSPGIGRRCTACCTALPLTYNKDMQEDKEHLFDTVDTLALSLAAARGMLETAAFRRERLAAAAADELIAAVDIADLRSRRGAAVPRGPRLVAGLVRAAVERRPAALVVLRRRARGARARARPRDALRALLRDGAWLESKISAGGTAQARVREQLEQRARRALPSGERAFYAREVSVVARALIGHVVRRGEAAGMIVETEAYHEIEPACHAYVGLTPRTSTLFGPPGRAYVYLSYGLHTMLNAVCEPEGVGAAVLIRALEPLEGIELMRERARPRARRRSSARGRGS